jgi:hypothetical protein
MMQLHSGPVIRNNIFLLQQSFFCFFFKTLSGAGTIISLVNMYRYFKGQQRKSNKKPIQWHRFVVYSTLQTHFKIIVIGTITGSHVEGYKELLNSLCSRHARTRNTYKRGMA